MTPQEANAAVLEHLPSMRRVVAAKLGSSRHRGSVDDATQEAVLGGLICLRSTYEVRDAGAILRTIAFRQAIRYRGCNAQAKQTERSVPLLEKDLPHVDPLPDADHMRIVHLALGKLAPRDREILTRFYLLEQPQEQIMAEMNLTSTQYRLNKNKAKVKFGEAGRRIARGAPARLAMAVVCGG